MPGYFIPLLALFAAAFLICFFLTPIARETLRRVGIVDCPDEPRKRHSAPVPRAGGVPIAMSFCLSYVILLFLPAQQFASELQLVRSLMPAFLLMFLTGLADDVYRLRPQQKLAGQFAAAAAACWAGVRIGAGQPGADWWTYPLTIVWLLGCTNAINLLDGVDGLATGVSLFAAIATVLAGVLAGSLPLLFVTVPLVGCLLAFLRFNFNPATIFLGDSGSLLLGFLLGCYGVIWSQWSTTLLGMTAPLMLMVIPLADTTLAIVRRFLRGQPVFQADRGHIHHRLLDRGWTPRRVVTVLYLVSGVAAAFSLLHSVARGELSGLVIVSFCAVSSAAMWIGLSRLGYVELDLAGRLLWHGVFSRAMLNDQLQLREFTDELSRAGSPRACWSALRKLSRALGFCSATLQIAGEHYHAAFGSTRRQDCWNISIPFSDGEYIELRREFGCPYHDLRLGPLLAALREAMAAKALEFSAVEQEVGGGPRAARASWCPNAT